MYLRQLFISKKFLFFSLMMKNNHLIIPFDYDIIRFDTGV